MKENGWDRGQDDEELFEFAMHEKQYREFKSGQAKEQFNADLADRMRKAGKTVPPELLPKKDTEEEDMAAVAMSLDLYYGGKSKTVAPFRRVLQQHRQSDWNRKIYGMNNVGF